VHSQCLQALSDITINLLSTSPFNVNRRLLERCCSQNRQPAQLREHAACLPGEGSSERRPVLRPSIEELLTLVGGCLQGVLLDPAVMGAAQQPAAWMPDKASVLASVAYHESRVQVSINEACSQGLLQQDMLRRLVY
jgi:hypothetical protein